MRPCARCLGRGSRGDVATGWRGDRVVLVDEPSGWVAFVRTNVSANVAEILSTVADRFSLATTFPDCKEIVGAGQQQVRFVWANIGAFNALPVDLHVDQGLGPVPRGGRAGGSLRISRDS